MNRSTRLNAAKPEFIATAIVPIQASAGIGRRCVQTALG